MTNYEIMTYCEGLLHINLHSPLNVWSREFMWQIEKIMSTLSHFLMITKFMWVVTHGLELPTITLHDPSMRWSCEVTWQIRYIIFPFPKTQRHKTNQGADLPWEVSTLKATWTFDVWSAWGHATIWKICISTFTRFMIAKLVWVRWTFFVKTVNGY